MWKSFVAASLLVVPIAAHAVPVLQSKDLFVAHDGLITLDHKTGLEWLDVSLTKGLTVDQVLAGGGQWLSLGFRYASFDDLSTMLVNGGLTVISDAPAGTKAFLEGIISKTDLGLSLVSMLGPTEVSGSGWQRVRGFTAPYECSIGFCDDSALWTYAVNLSAWPASLDVGSDLRATSGVSDDQIPTRSAAFPDSGSWLVRNRATNVPEPGPVGLLALGALGLAITGGRRARRTLAGGQSGALRTDCLGC